MATLDFRVKNGLVTGANNTTLGTAVTVLLGGNVGIGDSNPSSRLAVSGTLNATGAITQGGNQVLHAANFNSYTPTLTGTGASGTWGINITGNAETVDGFSASTSQAASTIVARDASGYAYFNYINSNTSNSENPAVSQVIVTNASDGFYRKASIAHLASAVQSNASGNWNINSVNITQFPLNQDVRTTASPTFAALVTTGTVTAAGDITTYRAASPTTGVIWLGNSGTRYLFYDGTNYILNGANLFIAGNLALHAGNYNSYSPTLTGGNASGTWGINITGSAPTLTTARTINGTSFNGSANITTVSWGTARTLTIGNTGKLVDGSGGVSWSLSEIGAPSTTGTGASGTWGINVTGSSTSAVNTVTGTNASDLVYGSMADSDQFRIRIGGTVTDGGFAEIATADNGTEPIYVRQYTGVFTTIARTLTLLDGSGNSSFPGAVNIVGAITQNGNQVLHAGNYNSYSPTLTGGNASGTWAISITGGLESTQGSLGYSASAANIDFGSQGGPQVRGQGGGAAMMSFHRPGAYAINFGLGTDNQLRTGGWSRGGNHVILDSGNYNSYAPTLTGGNASGTWAISITGRGYPRRSDGNDINFFWSGQSGQPTWLWGGNDGTNMYVYNPSNFSVNYANSAGSAGSASSATTFTSTSQNSQFNSIGIGTPASGTAGEIRATNNITAYYSDKRLKENIKRIENPLDKISKITGVTYNSNDVAASYGYTDTSTQVGVLAQEIEKVLPMAVKPAPFDITVNDDGVEVSKSGENYLTVQYEKIIPLLIEAIKELKTEIDELKGNR